MSVENPASPAGNTHRSRAVGIVLILAGVLALVGNLVHPRFSGDDVTIYPQIASSSSYLIADVVLLAALVLLTLGLVGVGDSLSGPFAEFGRRLALVGGTIAVTEIGVQLYALRQLARDFVSTPAADHVGSFWATEAVNHLDDALFATWSVVLLGLTPLCLALALVGARRGPSWLSLVGGIGGVVCGAVGVHNLLSTDHGSTDVPFLIGSLLVTVWVIGQGWVMYSHDAKDLA